MLMHHAILIGGHSLLRLFHLNSSSAVGIALRSHTPGLLWCVAVGTAVVLPGATAGAAGATAGAAGAAAGAGAA